MRLCRETFSRVKDGDMGLGNRRNGKKAVVAVAFFSCHSPRCFTIRVRMEVVRSEIAIRSPSSANFGSWWRAATTPRSVLSCWCSICSLHKNTRETCDGSGSPKIEMGPLLQTQLKPFIMVLSPNLRKPTASLVLRMQPLIGLTCSKTSKYPGISGGEVL